MFIYQGRKVNIDQPIEKDGVRYPNLRDAGIRDMIGVEEVADPVRPNPLTYSYAENFDGSLTITEKPKQQIISALWDQIKARRDSVTDTGGCKVGVTWFHTDAKSKQQQMALVILGANIPANLQWKALDGSFVTMTQTLAGQLFAAQVTREQQIFALAEQKFTSLANMTTSELEAFDVNAGWPTSFTGEQ